MLTSLPSKPFLTVSKTVTNSPGPLQTSYITKDGLELLTCLLLLPPQCWMAAVRLHTPLLRMIFFFRVNTTSPPVGLGTLTKQILCH